MLKELETNSYGQKIMDQVEALVADQAPIARVIDEIVHQRESARCGQC